MKIIKSMLLAVAAGGGLFTVADPAFSQNWTQTGAPSTNWYSVASSADGTKLVAEVVSGGIYTSTNSGATWTLTSAPSESWQGVASSADGVKLVATVNGGGIYTSTNSGGTWTQTSLPGTEWLSVASSADGTKLIAGDISGGPPGFGIYTSTNSGVTWISNSVSSFRFNLNWSSVAMSADGTKLVAVNWADGNIASVSSIYTSTNSGATWQTNNAPNKAWQSVVSSADGGKLVAAVEGGGLWISQTTPAPHMNITPTNGNLMLSWMVPSTNFVMQESPDLASWADMTNPPVLNLTNLQDEVILPPTNSSGFYRLKTP